MAGVPLSVHVFTSTDHKVMADTRTTEEGLSDFPKPHPPVTGSGDKSITQL